MFFKGIYLSACVRVFRAVVFTVLETKKNKNVYYSVRDLLKTTAKIKNALVGLVILCGVT